MGHSLTWLQKPIFLLHSCSVVPLYSLRLHSDPFPYWTDRLKKNALCCFEDKGNIFVRSILYTHQENSPFILILHTSQDTCAATVQPLQNRTFKSLSSEESSPVANFELKLFLYYLRFCCFPTLSECSWHALETPLYYASQIHARFSNLFH